MQDTGEKLSIQLKFSNVKILKHVFLAMSQRARKDMEGIYANLVSHLMKPGILALRITNA
jgi:hypothetical protein